MKYEDLDSDMKAIIQECQADFIRDSNERFDLLANYTHSHESGTLSTGDYAQHVQQQVHAMKGVARTIYYEVFHKKSEQLIFYIREHQETQWASIDIAYVKEEVKSLRNELDHCIVFE